MDMLRFLQRGKNERLTAAQLDRLLEEDAFRVKDDIRSDVILEDRHKDDLTSRRGYLRGEPVPRDHRMDNLERMMAAMTARTRDEGLERRSNTPVDPIWRHTGHLDR